MRTLLAFLLLIQAATADVVFYYPTGASLYVRFGDSANTAVTLTEGSTLKTGRYVAADSAITSAGLAAGTYTAGVFIGTAGSQSADDIRVGTISGFVWQGTVEIIEPIAGPRTWYVDGTTDGTGDNGSRSGPCDTITAAIALASPGDTIQIADGTYTEQVTINKERLTLVGESINNTIVTYNSGATITCDDFATIRNLTATTTAGNVADAIAIKPSGLDHVTLEDVVCNGAWDGCNAGGSDYFVARRCRFSGTYDGLNLQGSYCWRLEDCFCITDCTYPAVAHRAFICGQGTMSDPSTDLSNGVATNCIFSAVQASSSDQATTAVTASGRCIFTNCLFLARNTGGGTGVTYAITEPWNEGSVLTLHGGVIACDTAGTGTLRYVSMYSSASTVNEYGVRLYPFADTPSADVGTVRISDPTASDTNTAVVAGTVGINAAAIKAKTDNLPASPAATSDVTAIATLIGTPAGDDLAADIAAVVDAVGDMVPAAETRDLEPVQWLWTLKRTSTGAMQSTDESAAYVHAGDTNIRLGWNCDIPSVLPTGTVLASMTAPAADDADLTATELGIGPNGNKGPMCAKIELDVAADTAAGTYWITTTVTNSAGAGPITLYGKVVVLAEP